MSSADLRREAVARILRTRRIATQEELLASLDAAGVSATQATLSRDLARLGARRVSRPEGGTVYELADDATAGDVLGSLRGLVTSIVAFVPGMLVALTCGLCNTCLTGAYLDPSLAHYDAGPPSDAGVPLYAPVPPPSFPPALPPLPPQPMVPITPLPPGTPTAPPDPTAPDPSTVPPDPTAPVQMPPPPLPVGPTTALHPSCPIGPRSTVQAQPTNLPS